MNKKIEGEKLEELRISIEAKIKGLESAEFQ